MIRRFLFCLSVFLFAFCLSGCSGILPSRREINDHELIRVVGIDKAQTDDKSIEITVTSRMTEGATPEGGGEKRIVKNLTGTGPTIFEAIRRLQTETDKQFFFGHTDFFIIGEEAAKDNFAKYFDVIARDHEIRLNTKVYIVKGATAREVINESSTGSKFIENRLKNIDKDINALSMFSEAKVIDISSMLDNKNAATVIPALSLEKIEHEKSNTELAEKRVINAGYAIIMDGHLAGYIDPVSARGYNFLTNNVKATAVSVEDIEGEYVGLELINAKTEIKPIFNGDGIEKVLIETRFDSNLDEQHSQINLFKKDILKDLEQKQSEIIKTDMQNVISFSQQLGIDCFRLGESIRMKHPYKWEKIKESWRNIFPDLSIEVTVKSTIRRTYDIREPSGYGGGD